MGANLHYTPGSVMISKMNIFYFILECVNKEPGIALSLALWKDPREDSRLKLSKANTYRIDGEHVVWEENKQ